MSRGPKTEQPQSVLKFQGFFLQFSFLFITLAERCQEKANSTVNMNSIMLTNFISIKKNINEKS